jgi:hypothetical protein
VIERRYKKLPYKDFALTASCGPIRVCAQQMHIGPLHCLCLQVTKINFGIKQREQDSFYWSSFQRITFKPIEIAIFKVPNDT